MSWVVGVISCTGAIWKNALQKRRRDYVVRVWCDKLHRRNLEECATEEYRDFCGNPQAQQTQTP